MKLRALAGAPLLRPILGGTFAMAGLMGIGRFVYTPILPHMIEEAILDPRQAGIVAGFNYLGYMVGALAASASFFARSPRIWFFAGLWTSVATTLLMALAFDSVAAMILVRLLSGIGSAFGMIFVTTLVMLAMAEQGRADLATMHFGGVGLGIAGSAILVALLSAGGMHSPFLWFATGAVAALAATAAFLLLPVPPSPASLSSGPVRRSPMPPVLWLLIASYGLFGFGYVITATFINTMAKSEPVLAPYEPVVWVVVGLAGMPSIILWMKLARRHGVTAAYIGTCFFGAAGIALSVLILHPLTLMAGAIALGGTFMAVSAFGLARARELDRLNASRAIALMTAAFGLGQMIGPIVAGHLFDRFGDFRLASLLAATTLAIAGLMALGVGKHAGQP